MSNDAVLTIEMNDDLLNKVISKLEHFAVDQLPFALSQALFSVATDAREAMKAQVRRKFTIRQAKPWAERALTFDPSTRKKLRDGIRNGGEPSISIVSKDEDLGPLLTDGGTRRSQSGKDIGVPIIGGGRKTLQSKLTRRTGAQGVLKNKDRTLIITAKNGKRLLVIYPKKYKKGVKKSEQHKAMFHMREQVRIKPWWDARKVLLDAMDKWLPTRFEEHCREAMRTRK